MGLQSCLSEDNFKKSVFLKLNGYFKLKFHFNLKKIFCGNYNYRHLPINTITIISKKYLTVITITEKMRTRLPVLPELKDFSTVNKPCTNGTVLRYSIIFSVN